LGPTEQILPEDRDRIQSPNHCVLNKKNREMDNVQKDNNYIYMPSSKTFRFQLVLESSFYDKHFSR
jgi:hypothetical protein